MRGRVELQPGWLLALRPYRETSALLEVLTPDHGRVGLVARGARGAKSKLRGLLQPFAPLLLSWTESGELGSLTGIESAGAPILLSGEAVFYGWYVNELLLRLLQRHDAHPELLEDYASTLPKLAGTQAEPALRSFELRLLAELGYGFDLPDTLQAEAYYRIDTDGGLAPAWAGERAAVSGRALIALRDEALDMADAATLREARTLLRRALQRQLGERELETPKLLRALRAQAQAGAPNSEQHPTSESS